jgi:hypothetical protein
MMIPIVQVPLPSLGGRGGVTLATNGLFSDSLLDDSGGDSGLDGGGVDCQLEGGAASDSFSDEEAAQIFLMTTALRGPFAVSLEGDITSSRTVIFK